MFQRIRILGPIFALAVLAMAARPLLGRSRDDLGGNVPPPPPEPNPLEVTVPRGGPVWITLSAYSLTSPIIRFRIRQQPRDGKLGTPRLAAASTAIVLYTPPPGAGPGDDDFYYQVQSQAGVSAPAEVHIKLTDTDPVLIAPLELDFGDVLRSGSSRRVLEVQNIGGGLAEGTLRVPDGWTVDGDPDYSLLAGAKQSFTLVFQPVEERVYTGDITYTGSPGRATDVKGAEVPSIAVAPGPLVLREQGALRTGTIGLANRTDGPLTVRLTPGPQLDTDAIAVVPAKGVAAISVRAKAGVYGAIRDSVTLEGDDLKASIPVYAAAEAEIVPSTEPSAVSDAPMVTPGRVATTAPRPAAPVLPQAPADAGLVPITMPLLDPGDSGVAEPRIAVTPLEVGSAGEHAASVSSDFKGAAPVQAWRLEQQTVGRDAAGLGGANWQPMANATVQVNGTTVTAVLARLMPGSLYVVRLVGVDEQQRIVAISAAAPIWTLRAKGGMHWGWVALAAGALAFAAWKWRTRRRW